MMSAFVEIVFDNSDNRIPVDREEIRLRRTIGLKKDEYYLDRKHILKTEVMNLLESAGFSRSNPYYVVQQGKIASLTLMKDSERLDLLKEIGGTRVYEERRRESLKIMQDTELKRSQILEVVKNLEERLTSLDEEKEELRKYQQLDKDLRSLEYTIFDKELNETKNKLEKVEESRNRVSEKSGTMHNSAQESHDRLKEIEKELKMLTRSVQTAETEKETAEKLRTETVKVSTNIEVDIRYLQTQMETERRLQEDIGQELKSIEEEVEVTRQELERVKPMYEEAVSRELDCNKRQAQCEKQSSLLYQKRCRPSQFSSKVERDRHIQNEILKTEELVRKEQSLISGLEEDVNKLNDRLAELSEVKSNKQKQWEEREVSIKRAGEGVVSMKIERDNLHGMQKNLRKQELELEEAQRKAREEISQADRGLEGVMPRDARQGLAAVKRLVRDHHIEGVHGILLELVHCEDKFNTAVEVTAGNSLFHMVVETDDTAQRLTKYLVQDRLGRITFYPLNRMRAPHVNFPNDKDTVPLLKKIRVDPKFQEVCAHVFGRTVICRDLDVATRVAKSCDIDCVTMDGDQVEKKGAMRGGYVDKKRQKLKLVAIRRENGKLLEQFARELNAVRAASIDCDQKIILLMGEMEKLETEQRHGKYLADQLKMDMREVEAEVATIKRKLDTKERSIQSISDRIFDYEDTIQVKRQEMGSDLTGQLTEEESEQLANLNLEHEQLKEEHLQCQKTLMNLEQQKNRFELSLTQNLLRRKDELETQLSSLDFSARELELQSKQKDLQIAKTEANEASQLSKKIIQEMEKQQKEIRKLKNEREVLKQAKDEYDRILQDESKEMEQLLNKRVIFQQQRDDLMKKIRDLGSLPADAFEKYQNKNLKDLHKMMHRCNEQLKKYSHVNKKALDQYVTFTEQREELQKRQAELDKGDEKIKELISALDMRKDEAIERTFKGVAKNFREAFRELVPQGYGALIMLKKRKGDERDDDDDDDDDSEGEGGGHKRIEKYSGVKVKVSFTGQGETQTMKQLSGGQKTVVALTLIFAIQRCDPAPFYLFDEIDAALDPQYRTAVGNMIRRQADSSQTQFITTTFRPELVKVADQIYGVFHKNRVSRVEIIRMESALKFIEQDQGQQNE